MGLFQVYTFIFLVVGSSALLLCYYLLNILLSALIKTCTIVLVVRFFDPQKNGYFKTNPYQFVLKIKAGKRSSLKVGKLMTILNNVPSSWRSATSACSRSYPRNKYDGREWFCLLKVLASIELYQLYIPYIYIWYER